jgi:hypothetical protein
VTYLRHHDPAHLAKAVEQVEAALVGQRDRFDVVVATGLSGVIPAAIWCHHYDCRLVVVRKRNDDSHGVIIEGDFHHDDRWILLDDFVSSGRTIDRVISELRGWFAWRDEHPHPYPEFIVLHAMAETLSNYSVRLIQGAEQYDLQREDGAMHRYAFRRTHVDSTKPAAEAQADATEPAAIPF